MSTAATSAPVINGRQGRSQFFTSNFEKDVNAAGTKDFCTITAKTDNSCCVNKNCFAGEVDLNR